MEKTEKVKQGIEDYLALFDKSPYSCPPNDRKVVTAIAPSKGIWQLATA